MSRDWQTLGQLDPKALVDARLQLHHALQVVSAVGMSLLEPRPDDSHPNTGWRDDLAALVGHAVPGSRPFRAALRPATLELEILGGAGEILDALALDGRTLKDAYAWLEEAVRREGGIPHGEGLRRTPYDLPAHPTSDGAPFALAPEACQELARWFANGHSSLHAAAREREGASEVRCWPHHFDLGSLIVVEHDADGDATRTVGIGLSPGDESYAEPYWYVSPWPAPDALPRLTDGHWHTEGFTSAVLTASELVATGDGQPVCARRFLDEAIAASRSALSD